MNVGIDEVLSGSVIQNDLVLAQFNKSGVVRKTNVRLKGYLPSG